MTNRKIPRTMGTQHPDNARKPHWAQSAFIDTQTEVEEAFRNYSDLSAQEFMWDWEGKHVDESVVEKLFEHYTDFFQNHPLGKDIFLTTRLPNIWEEKGYRLPKAFVNIISSNQMARDVGWHAPALFEAILPMTRSVDQLDYLHARFRHVAKAFESPDALELIPLVEEVHAIQSVDQLLRAYVQKEPVQQLRVFLARSDPALNAGNTAATLAAKNGLDALARFSETTGIKTHPIIGVGSLPFRGGLSPLNVGRFFQEYGGVQTVTLQSAFRYDFDPADVQAAVNEINDRPLHPAQNAPEGLERVTEMFTQDYQQQLHGIAGLVNQVAAHVPKRRERRLHVGLFGYARQMQGTNLPRAIAFTAALYSLGVPPEFLGVGKTVSRLSGKQRDALYQAYVYFEDDLVRAGHYLNRENLRHLAAADPAWESVEHGLHALEEQTGRKFGPHEDAHFIHRNITSNVRLLLKSGKDISQEIVRAGELRKSLG